MAWFAVVYRAGAFLGMWEQYCAYCELLLMVYDLAKGRLTYKHGRWLQPNEPTWNNGSAEPLKAQSAATLCRRLCRSRTDIEGTQGCRVIPALVLQAGKSDTR